VTSFTGLLLLDGALAPGRVHVAAGRIAKVERLARVHDDAPIVAPGLVDLHVHGYAGCEPLADLPGLALALAAVGTTAFLPTLFPDEPARLGAQAQSTWARRDGLPAGSARVLGVHLEGPFVNPLRAGGLPRDRLAEPSPEALRDLIGPATGDGRGIRQVTLAPELPGADALVRELVRSGVRVSLGHSAATAADAARASAAGARGATHLFNAMDPLHHRKATLASFALAEDALVAEIIGDLVHVGPEAFRIALRARGVTGLALVSDALIGAGGAGGPEAEFESHGRRCRIRDGAIWIVEDAGAAGASGAPDGPGRLTGAEACQLDAVRRLVRANVATRAQALTLASESPARALGLADELGRLAEGTRADLLVLDPQDLALRAVLVGGTPLTL
jgi:N-acetylglucosamine-6-phosphate deacetylase